MVCVSAVLSAIARAVWPSAMVLYSVVFALLFQVSTWVSACVVLEEVRVVHVIICKCVVQRGVALLCSPWDYASGGV